MSSIDLRFLSTFPVAYRPAVLVLPRLMTFMYSLFHEGSAISERRLFQISMESGVEGSWQSVEEDCLSVEQTSDNGKLLEDDPFAYLNRKEFTSEKFKIEIR